MKLLPSRSLKLREQGVTATRGEREDRCSTHEAVAQVRDRGPSLSNLPPPTGRSPATLTSTCATASRVQASAASLRRRTLAEDDAGESEAGARTRLLR